jgi:hypothetical protein
MSQDMDQVILFDIIASALIKDLSKTLQLKASTCPVDEYSSRRAALNNILENSVNSRYDQNRDQHLCQTISNATIEISQLFVKHIEASEAFIEQIKSLQQPPVESYHLYSSAPVSQQKSNFFLMISNLPQDVSRVEIITLSNDIHKLYINQTKGRISKCFAFLGFRTEEKRNDHFFWLNNRIIRSQHAAIRTHLVSHHDLSSLKRVQDIYDKSQGDDHQLKTIVIFGINEDTSERQLERILPKNGGIRQTFGTHCTVQFSSWFDAELALNELTKKSINGRKLMVGFDFERDELAERFESSRDNKRSLQQENEDDFDDHKRMRP